MQYRDQLLKKRIYLAGIVAGLFFFCQSFQCSEKDDSEIYIGGMIRDKETKENISDIEIWVDSLRNRQVTDQTGKFGLIVKKNPGKYMVHFCDRRKEKIYVDRDTFIISVREKIIVDILLRKKN